jgi:hypothetical protein
VVGDYPIEEAEFIQRRYAEIVITSVLNLVEIARRRTNTHGYSQRRSTLYTADARPSVVARLLRAPAPDGIIYSSRLNDDPTWQYTTARLASFVRTESSG